MSYMYLCVFFPFAWRSTIYRYKKKWTLSTSFFVKVWIIVGLRGLKFGRISILFSSLFFFFTLNLRSLSLRRFKRIYQSITLSNFLSFARLNSKQTLAFVISRFCLTILPLSFFRYWFFRSFGVYFTFALKYQRIMIVWHSKWIFSALQSFVLINCSIWKEFIKNIQVIYHDANRRENEYRMTPSSVSSLTLSVCV